MSDLGTQIADNDPPAVLPLLDETAKGLLGLALGGWLGCSFWVLVIAAVTR